MNFTELKKLIKKESADNNHSFDESSDVLEKKIFELSKDDLKQIISQVGTIPEDIEHDSTEEKLFSKATDIVLAKTLQELGLSASVNKERSNCADVVAKSIIHNYSLVGDAKTFRLSRTAKNQKDYKVKSMIDWKGDNDCAVLVCPYYQYPKSNSQIYGQALDHNVCLLSWEHLLLFLNKSIVESKTLNLLNIWNLSDKLAGSVTVKNKDKNINFYKKGNQIICEYLGISNEELDALFGVCRKSIISRGKSEIKFWEKQINKIQKYSREKAVKSLVYALKLKEKIGVIQKFINSLRKEENE